MGGGFGSGCYRLKNKFFSLRLVIVKPPISIKNGTNVFLLNGNLEIPAISQFLFK